MLSPRVLVRPRAAFSAHRLTPQSMRFVSTAQAGNDNPKEPPKRKPLTKEQRDFLSSAVCHPDTFPTASGALPSGSSPQPPTNTPPQLRVNQAGELAATLIYTAQTPPIVNRHPHLRPVMSHMYAQEEGHLNTFNALLARHRVRPSALYPLWSVMATGLGWGTALMGREAAMACTEAVETEIGDHYNAQIRTLLEMISQWEAEGYEVGEEFRELLGTLRRIRDEELEHLDHAVEHDAKKAEPHWLLTGLIRLGCRGAIYVSERV